MRSETFEDGTWHDLLPLSVIRTDRGTQVRKALSEAHVERLAGVIGEANPNDSWESDGEAFAYDHRKQFMIDVFVTEEEPSEYILAAGFHRLEAHRRAGLDAVWCRVHPGDDGDAKFHAARSNSRHGLPLTKAERLVALRMLMSLGTSPTPTQADYAEWLQVSQPTISRMLKQIEREDAGRMQVNKPARRADPADFGQALRFADRLRKSSRWDLEELYVKIGLMLDADEAAGGRSRMSLDARTDKLRADGIVVPTNDEHDEMLAAVTQGNTPALRALGGCRR